MNNNYDFYDIFYKAGFLNIEELKEATKWGVIKKDDFLNITGKEYKVS